jgi:hypothetical protein
VRIAVVAPAAASLAIAAIVLTAHAVHRQQKNPIVSKPDDWDDGWRPERGDCSLGYVNDYFGNCGVPFCRPAGLPSCDGCADEAACFGRLMQRELRVLPYRYHRYDWEHMIWALEIEEPACPGRKTWWDAPNANPALSTPKALRP